MPTRFRLAAFASTMVMALALSAGLSVSVAGAAWSIQTTPAPPKGTATYLYDVSCEPSTELCTAVGRSSNAGVDSPLALRRNGISWSAQSPAKKSGSTHNRLLGIDCPSETRCIAVGNYQNSEGGPATLGELWNESKWSVQTTPVPAEATSSELVAVGCNSTASCRAAGSAVIKGVKTAIIEKWASPTWSSQTIPIPEGATSSQLDGIDCIWSNFCAAVGRYTTSGGSVKSLIMFWDGTEWKLHTVTDPEGAVESTLLDVSCTPTPNRCTAVGGWKKSGGEQLPLAYRFNGVTTWTLQSTPNPTESTTSVFQEVSCATETSCTAAGSWVSSGGGSNKTLAEEWNGSSWSIQNTPNPPGEALNSFFGVSCRGITCLGVGWSLNTENPAMAQVSPPANTFRFIHDADGRLRAAIDPEGEAAFYGWDAGGNLTSISRGSSSKLSIVGLSPAKGAVGETIKIKGTGFSTTPASNTVKFNGTAATVEAATQWSLTVKVPAGATSGSVTVATSGEPVTSPENFTVATGKPSISSLSPTTAASGEEVTISGSNFESSAYDNAVALNGFRPALNSASSSAIKFNVPAERLGGKVSVATPQGSTVGPDLFVPPTGTAASKVGTAARISLGESKTFSLAGSEKVALVLFDGTVGEQVSLVGSENTISGTLSIWSPSGSELISGGFSGLVGPVTLPRTGTYTVMLKPSGSGTGSVKVTSYGFSDLTGTINPPATAEGLKQPVSLTVPGQTARYSVEVKAGEKYSLQTTNSNMTGTYYIKWLDPSGSWIYGGAWGPKENWFLDSNTFSTTGTWTLLVDPVEENTGSVDLKIWETPDLTGQSITPSSEGGSVTSTINVPGQRELISFSGTASQLITLKAQESTIAIGSMSILKPEGAPLSGSEVSFTSGSSGKNEVTLPSTGTYTIVVDPPTTGSNPVTNGTGSVKAIVYLGSHVAWRGVDSNEPQLVSLSRESWLSGNTFAAAYSDIPPGWPISSTSRPSDAEDRQGEKEVGSQGISQRQKVRQRPPLSTSRKSHRRSGTSARPLPYRWQPDHRGAWLPPGPGEKRNWLVGRSSSPWLGTPPLEANSGTTGLAGQVLRVDGLPVAGVSVSIEGTNAHAETDGAGRFLIDGLSAGHQVLVVHGEGPGGRRYGTYEIGVDATAEETTVLDYTIWLTPLDRAGDLRVDSPVKHEVSLRTARVPGLEVKMPAGTAVIGDDGRAVKDLNITAIPLDRPPFPLPPFVTVPVYFTVQPGGARLSRGARFVYPNWGELSPGERVDFWNYDPEDRGWYVYGRGTVTEDGKQVVPDPGVRVWELTGAMAVSGPTPPGTGPRPSGSPNGGDPVDFYTGLLTYGKTDLTLPDTIPISIERTYRTNDSNSYSFGEGMTNAYDLRLWPIVNYKEADLILPDGGRVHYVRTSPGTSWSDAVYQPTGDVGMFGGSVITWNGSSWNMALTNGITFTFGGFAPLIAIKDRFGNTLTIKRAGGLTGNIKEIVSPNGRWAKFTYDEANRITEIVDNGGRKLKYTYTSGRLTKVEAPGSRTTQYEYDGSGRMKAVINARGNKYLQNEYDANGRVKKQTAGDGGTFEFAYELDEAGKVKATTITDPLGNQRKAAFDSEGFSTSETEAPGTGLAQTTSVERQAGTGLILSETDPLGRETDFDYDSSGNVIKVTRLAGTEGAVTTELDYEPGTTNVTEVTDPLGHTTKSQYGSKGQLLKTTDALGHETTFKYNAEGQPIEVTNAEAETTKLSYENGDLVGATNPLGNTTTRGVDTLGRVRSATLPGGERYLYTYNEADQLTSATSPLGAKTTIEYDADGHRTAIIDPRSGKTTMTYDVMDRLTKETDPLEKAVERVYNKAGDIVEAVDRRGKVSKLTYDALRRPTGASYGVSGKTSESSIGYEYDEADRLTRVNDSAGGEYTLAYDGLDRLAAVGGPNGSIGYEYDAAGRRTLMEVPGGTVGYEYDNANRLTKLTSGAQTVSLGYDKADRLESQTLPNGIKQLYGYDKAGEATSIAYKKGESTLGEINYAYDADGHTEAMWGSYSRLSFPEALKSTKYDAANELTEREGKKLSYDADGDLTADSSNEYTWNARGQLTKISGANTASFGYDPFGRRSSKALGGTTTKLLSDGPNVVQESVEGKVTADLLTGLAADQLFSRTTKAGTSSYLTNLLGSTIALANGSGEVKTSYTYDPFGGMTKEGEATDNPYQFTGRENDGTGLQYNRARFYSSSMGRFISQDPAGFAGSGANLYWYANGNPVDFTDPSGEWPCDHVGDWSGAGGGVSSKSKWDWKKVCEEALKSGIASGAGGLLGGPIPGAIGLGWGLLTGAGGELAGQWLTQNGYPGLGQLVGYGGVIVGVGGGLAGIGDRGIGWVAGHIY